MEIAMSTVSRRDLLAVAGAATALAAAAPVAAADEPAKGKERTYEGESRAGKLDEALGQALGKLSGDLGAGGVADGLAAWKLAEVTGQLGGFAGFHSVKVKITATRSPDWPKD
jgi:hypothetical protein